MLAEGDSAPDFTLPDQDGRTYWGVQRATFVIDPGGKIARVFPKVSPQTHDELVLKALRESSAA